MRRSALLIQAMVVGATAGLLTEVVVLRLNPEVAVTPSLLVRGALLWSLWGMVGVGLPLAAALWLLSKWKLRGGVDWWPTPAMLGGVYVIAAAVSWVNHDIHKAFLTGSGHRTLGQDGVAWLLCGLLALIGGAGIRRLARPALARPLFAAFFLVLPLVRIATQPSPAPRTLGPGPRPLGYPARPLLVVGIEGLDRTVLLGHEELDRYPSLERLVSHGAWGPLAPHRPYLRGSLWTTVATGAYPRRHGVEGRLSWHLPWLGEEPLRLLPWLPTGSRWMLPPFVARPQPPPQSRVPPLWTRLQASGVTSHALGWPGHWGELELEDRRGPTAAALDADLRTSLTVALEPFPSHQGEVLAAVEADARRLDLACRQLREGTRDLWLHLEALAVARRDLEPLDAGDTGEREVLRLVLELLDEQVAALSAGAAPETLMVVLSPAGMEPPDPWERLRRLLGAGGTWRTSADSCPDGVLILLGPGVVGGRRFTRAQLTDVVPTVCYLLDLPVAQYMEGRVVLEAVDPAFLSVHRLRVID